MEYRFLLCDDLESHVDILEKYIGNCMGKKGVLYKCYKTTSGAEALEMYEKQKYDIAFLDVEMPDVSGIEIAEKIFNIDKDAVIIYVTAYHQYAEKAYEQFVFHYITKPINEARLGIVLDKALEKIEENKHRNNEIGFFIIKKDNKKIKIMNRDVLYFEKIINNVNIYMVNNENISIRTTFKMLEKVIDMRLYLRCHNGFIINKSKIQSVSSKNIEILDAKTNTNKIVPIGRNYKKAVFDYYFKVKQ